MMRKRMRSTPLSGLCLDQKKMKGEGGSLAGLGKTIRSIGLRLGIFVLGISSAISGQSGNLRPSSPLQTPVGEPSCVVRLDEANAAWRSARDSEKTDNPDLELIREWLNKRKPSKLPSELKTITISDPMEMISPSLQRLFPTWRIYRISWYEEYTKKGLRYMKKKGFIDSSSHFELIAFAVNRQTRCMIPCYEYGNYESFGELLAQNKITIASQGQAEAVWDAFCEMHNKQWRSQPHIKSGSSQWRLGVTCDKDTQYYYEVNLDGSGIVVHAILKGVKIK